MDLLSSKLYIVAWLDLLQTNKQYCVTQLTTVFQETNGGCSVAM